MTISGLVPVFVTPSATAAQITNRQVLISTSQSAATGVEYDFTFSWGTATDVEGVIFQFCTTPLGTCTLPNSMVVDYSSTALDSHTNFPGTSGGAAFSEVTSDTGDCNATATTMYCINRTEPTSATGTNATVDLSGITNPTLSGSPFTTVYVRISLYNNDTFTGPAVHNGVVAAGITQQLTTAGRVQERLEFCVAAIDDDDSLPASCSAFPSTVTVDIGVIDNNGVSISPVEPTATNGANDAYGIAMVNTNAAGGVVVAYFAEEATNVSASDADQLRTFRVLPTDCSATITSVTDQCFVGADGTTGTTFVAGTEDFGLQIPCIDANDGTRSTTSNLGSVPAAYSNTDNNTASVTNCEGHSGDPGFPDTGEKFGWNLTGTAATLASSSSVVDDEVLKIRFGATASATTPTGTYVVITTYIATPTF